MSKRGDIKNLSDALDKGYGLIYSEVLGWIDMGHALGNDIKDTLDKIQKGEMSGQPYYVISYAQSMEQALGGKLSEAVRSTKDIVLL